MGERPVAQIQRSFMNVREIFGSKQTVGGIVGMVVTRFVLTARVVLRYRCAECGPQLDRGNLCLLG